jgi:branched-subunit amino acid ABC-type transport system permease component
VQILISGITSGCIYAIVGLGIAVVYNVTRIFDVSQGQYLMLSAMLVALFRSYGLSLGSSLGLAIVISVAVGLLIWRIIFYGASQKHSSLTLIMMTFGVASLIEGIAFIVFGTDVRMTSYYVRMPPIRIFKATMSPQAPIIYGVLLLTVIGLSFLFGRSIIGKALRACHEQPFAARLMGINPRRMMYLSFVMAVGLSAIGGMAMVPLTTASYNMGMHFIIKGFLASIVGGISRFEGVIAGGLALGLLESAAAGFISSSYASVIALTFFVIVLLFRPTGILGAKEIRT